MRRLDEGAARAAPALPPNQIKPNSLSAPFCSSLSGCLCVPLPFSLFHFVPACGCSVAPKTDPALVSLFHNSCSRRLLHTLFSSLSAGIRVSVSEVKADAGSCPPKKRKKKKKPPWLWSPPRSLYYARVASRERLRRVTAASRRSSSQTLNNSYCSLFGGSEMFPAPVFLATEAEAEEERCTVLARI